MSAPTMASEQPAALAPPPPPVAEPSRVGGAKRRRPCAGDFTVKRCMQTAFGRLGYWVASHATAVIVCSVAAVPLCALGMLRFEIDLNIQVDFAPVNARSLDEQRIMSQFYNRNGRLYHFTAPIWARDGGNLFRPEYRRAIESVVAHVETGIRVPVERNGTVRHMSYVDMCRSTCELNRAAGLLLYFYHYNGSNNSPAFRASYPNIKLHAGNELYIADHVYDVQLNEEGIMESMGVFKLLLRTTVPAGPLVEALDRYEVAVAGYMQQVHDNTSELLDMAYGGHHMIGLEAMGIAMSALPFIPMGLALTTLFTMFASARFAAGSDPRDSKPYTAAIGILAPLMATAVSAGLLTAFGHKYKAFLATAPFLILAIGVDDIFIVLHAWRKVDKSLATAERVRHAMADAGPTITLTSLTNVISMLCGIVNATPAISQFCTWTATGVAINWLYQVLFFTAVLHHSAKYEGRSAMGGARQRLTVRKERPMAAAMDERPAGDKADLSRAAPPQHAVARSGGGWLRAYSAFACTGWARALVAATMALYLAGASYGFFGRLRADLSQDKVAAKDSLTSVFAQFLDEHEYREAATVFVLVARPPDLRLKRHRDKMQQLVREFERDTSGGEHSIGAASTQFWLRDYYNYMQFHDSFLRNTNASFTYRLLPSFLDTPPFTRWQHAMHVRRAECRRDSPACISGYIFSTGFKNAVSWAQRLRVLDNWRAIVDRYGEYAATVYEDLALYSDQMQIIVWSTTFSIVCALFAVFVVCCAFIASPWPVLAAVAALTSIVYGLVGYMPFFGFDLDPMTMGIIVTMIGYSVDFAAHIPYHYYKDVTATTTAGRIESALLSIGGPMVQAGVTTVLVILGLYFVNSYICDAVLYMQPFTVLSGLYHGLVVLPTVLAAVAPVRRTLP